MPGVVSEFNMTTNIKYKANFLRGKGMQDAALHVSNGPYNIILVLFSGACSLLLYKISKYIFQDAEMLEGKCRNCIQLLWGQQEFLCVNLLVLVSENS